jgi:hypothetical protein
LEKQLIAESTTDEEEFVEIKSQLKEFASWRLKVPAHQWPGLLAATVCSSSYNNVLIYFSK